MKFKENICTIIMAAGASSRFGSNKLLHPVSGLPMYYHIVNLAEHLSGTYTAHTIIVTKYREIVQNVPPDFSVVINDKTHLGQSYSVKLALQCALQMPCRFDAFLFCTGDQPYLRQDSLQKLCLAWQQKRGICALAWQNKRRSPVIFDACYVPELLKTAGDQGGRSVIAAHLAELTLVEAVSEREAIDIDTVEQLNL